MSWFGLPFAPTPKCNRRLAQQHATNKQTNTNTNTHTNSHAHAHAHVHEHVHAHVYVQVLETATQSKKKHMKPLWNVKYKYYPQHKTAQRMTAHRSVIHPSFSLFSLLSYPSILCFIAGQLPKLLQTRKPLWSFFRNSGVFCKVPVIFCRNSG